MEKQRTILKSIGRKHFVFQKKFVKIAKPLVGKLFSVTTPMVQVKIEPNSGDFEEVGIDGSKSKGILNSSLSKKSKDIVVYMCKPCKMYFPLRQMLTDHNLKIHPPENRRAKKETVAVTNVVTSKLHNPSKKKKQLLLQTPSSIIASPDSQDKIYFTGYYKNPNEKYVCSYCDFSSFVRKTVASHAALKHNLHELDDAPETKAILAGPSDVLIEPKEEFMEEDNEDNWPVEMVEDNEQSQLEFASTDEQKQQSIESTVQAHMRRKQRDFCLKTVANKLANLQPSSVGEMNSSPIEIGCLHCPYKTSNRSTMRSHVIRKHNPVLPEENIVNERDETQTCTMPDPESKESQDQMESNKLRQCPFCPFKTLIKSTLNSHVARRHGQQPHPLSAKGKSRKSQFNAQLYTGYACYFCTFAAATISSIRSHIAKEHIGRKQPLQEIPVKEFDCDQCDFKSKSRRSMQLHLKDCHMLASNAEGTYACHACSYETQSRMGLQRHVSIKHSVLPVNDIAESAYFSCENCEYKSLNEKLIDWHKKQHSESNYHENDGNQYICNECDFSTWTKTLLHQHIKRKHKDIDGNDKEPDTESEQYFVCKQCDYTSKNKHVMKIHVIRKHTNVFNHECEVCGKKYKVKADLTNHIRFQHREQPIICDVCGKTCRNSNLLYLHQKFAHYKPDFECHICHRRMVSQANLDDHILKQHEQLEESVCEECGKTFRKASRLKLHMRVHTGVKPYSCKICMKSFARRNGLRQHLLIHTGKRPYICDICGKSFTQKTGLISHRKMHPGDKPPLPRVTIDHVLTELFSEET